MVGEAIESPNTPVRRTVGDLLALDVTIEAVPVDDEVIADLYITCLLYTSDAADDLLCVALGGRRIIQNNDYH